MAWSFKGNERPSSLLLEPWMLLWLGDTPECLTEDDLWEERRVGPEPLVSHSMGGGDMIIVGGEDEVETEE
jgi:hypothetical protein